MSKIQYKVDLVNGDTLFNMLNYLCSKVDWAKLALNNKAVVCRNTLFTELKKDKRIIRP